MHFTRDDNLYEDFTVGETIVHPRGRTVSDEPWARLTMCITPKISDSPLASRNSKAP